MEDRVLARCIAVSNKAKDKICLHAAIGLLTDKIKALVGCSCVNTKSLSVFSYRMHIRYSAQITENGIRLPSPLTSDTSAVLSALNGLTT